MGIGILYVKDKVGGCISCSKEWKEIVEILFFIQGSC